MEGLGTWFVEETSILPARIGPTRVRREALDA
jgi:hypothetical protein